jgi:hypothetical protein
MFTSELHYLNPRWLEKWSIKTDFNKQLNILKRICWEQLLYCQGYRLFYHPKWILLCTGPLFIILYAFFYQSQRKTKNINNCTGGVTHTFEEQKIRVRIPLSSDARFLGKTQQHCTYLGSISWLSLHCLCDLQWEKRHWNTVWPDGTFSNPKSQFL